MPSNNQQNNKREAVELSLLGIAVFFLISIPLNDFISSLKFMFAFFSIFYLPFILLVDKLNIGIIEKFALILVSGLTYGGIYVFFDVFLKVQLTKALFLAVSLSVFSIGLISQMLIKVKD